MKRFLDVIPLPWTFQQGTSDLGTSDALTPPELTFDDSFFVELPEKYEPWREDGITQDVPALGNSGEP